MFNKITTIIFTPVSVPIRSTFYRTILCRYQNVLFSRITFQGCFETAPVRIHHSTFVWHRRACLMVINIRFEWRMVDYIVSLSGTQGHNETMLRPDECETAKLIEGVDQQAP
jgi:hypothetical protein